MDQRRTIIIILSICVVAIVVTGVALWLLYPRSNGTASGSNGTTTTYVQGLSPSPNSDASGSTLTLNGTGTSTGGTSNSVSQNQSLPQASPAAGASPTPNGAAVNNTNTNTGVVIVYGPNPSYKTGPDGTLIRIDNGQAGTGVIVLPSPQPSSGPAKDLGNIGASPAPTTAPSAKPGTSPAPAKNPNLAKTTTPKPSAAPAKVAGKEFWIQIISTPNRDRVDQVKHDLSQLGFNGRVTTKTVSGVDYFRLRYGPYSRADEAQKFLDWVKAIKGFEQSYLAEETTQAAK